MNLHTRCFHTAILFTLLVSTGCVPQVNAQGRSIYDNGVEWVDDYFLNLSPDARVIDYPYVYTKVSYGLQLSRIVQGQDSVWLETLDLVNGYDYNNRWPVSFAVGENLVAWGYEFLHIACRNGDSLEKLYEGEVSGNPVHFFRQITPDSLLLYDSGIISLHDPSNPEVLWQSPFFMECQQIIVDTLLLYGTEEYLFIYDITNPRNPVPVDTLDGAWGYPYYSHTKPQRIGNTVGFFIHDRANFIRFAETPGEYETFEWLSCFPVNYTCFWGGIVQDSLFAFAAFKSNDPIRIVFFDPDLPLDEMEISHVSYPEFYHPSNAIDELFAEDWAVDDTLLIMGRSYASRVQLYNLSNIYNSELLVDTVFTGKRPYLLDVYEHMGLFQYGRRGFVNLRTGSDPDFAIPSISLICGLKNDLKDSLLVAMMPGEGTTFYEIETDSVIERCEISSSYKAEIIPHDSLDLMVSIGGDSITIFNCIDDTFTNIHSSQWGDGSSALDIVCGDSVIFVRYGYTLTSWRLNNDFSLTFIDSIELDRRYFGCDIHYEFPYVCTGNLVYIVDESYSFNEQLFFPAPPGLGYNMGIRSINNHRIAVYFRGDVINSPIVIFDISEGLVTDTLAYVHYGDEYCSLDGDTLWVSSHYCLSKYVLTEFNDVPESNPWSNDSTIPITFELLPAWPNPFNSTVSIPFTLPTSCTVVVSVYDILGRRVALVTDEVYPSGYNVVRFSPTSLSSGTYFATLSTPFSHQTRRLVLLK